MSPRSAPARSRRAAPSRRTRSGGRGRGRPRRYPRRRRGWRRFLPLAAGLGAVALAALVVTNLDRFEEALREVTLPLRHEDIIRQQSAEKEVPADLIAAVIYAESRFRDQTSDAGARGLMQITRPTADEIERLSGGQTFEYDDLADPDINIRYGTFYLRHLLDSYHGNQVAAVAAYNAGPSRVSEWGGERLELDDIELEETKGYVEDVLDKREDYREHYSEELGLGP